MSEKIQSMIRKYVRLKQEYFYKETYTEDLCDDDGDVIEENGVTVTKYCLEHKPKIIGTRLRYFGKNWAEEAFEVYAEFYGVDMSRLENSFFTVGYEEPTHMIAMKDLDLGGSAYGPTFYDASLFEVVKEHKTWILDTEFYNRPDCITNK